MHQSETLQIFVPNLWEIYVFGKEKNIINSFLSKP